MPNNNSNLTNVEKIRYDYDILPQIEDYHNENYFNVTLFTSNNDKYNDSSNLYGIENVQSDDEHNLMKDSHEEENIENTRENTKAQKILAIQNQYQEIQNQKAKVLKNLSIQSQHPKSQNQKAKGQEYLALQSQHRESQNQKFKNIQL